jgi:arylformamidase
MTKIIDVTAPLSTALPIFPGDPTFEIRLHNSLARGDAANVSAVSMGVHTGTHVDAPCHFIEGGLSVERLPLEILTGKARVVEARGDEAIGRDELERLDLRDDLRLLLKTRMSGQLRHSSFQKAFVHLTADAATYLVQAGIKLVGIDYLSIEAYGSHDYPVHRTLLAAGVVIVEGLDLQEVEAGEYDMTCLPLPIVGADGAPARVILRTRVP